MQGRRAKPNAHHLRVHRWIAAVTASVAVILFVIAGSLIAQSTSVPSPSSHHVPTQTAPIPSETAVVSASPTPSASPATPVPPVQTKEPEVTSASPPAPVQPVIVVASKPIRFVYSDLGINMPTVPMDGRSYVLDPPVDTNAHWLNNYGLVGTGSHDTAYIIAHSCGLGYPGCSPETFPFNKLSTQAAVGQLITVFTETGEVRYRVTDVFSYDKNSTPAEKRGTWDPVPGRLVVMSCYTADLLGKNVVVFAQLEK